MPEYISRDAAIKSTWMILEGMGYPRSENRSLERTVEAVFQSAPAADVVERPRWVSVTERLPDAYEEVILQFPNNQAAGFCDRDGCWGVYSGDGFYTEVADNEPKPTHWAKKLPEPPKEEA